MFSLDSESSAMLEVVDVDIIVHLVALALLWSLGGRYLGGVAPFLLYLLSCLTPWKVVSLFCISCFAFSLVFLYPDVLLKGTSPESLETQGIPEKEHTCLLISSCRGTWGSAACGASALALLLSSIEWKEHPWSESQHSWHAVWGPLLIMREQEAEEKKWTLVQNHCKAFQILPG